MRQNNLQGQGQHQPLQSMIQGSANAYASMLNSTLLFPLFLYQQGLTLATQVALGSLRAATTGVAAQQQGTQAYDRTDQQDVRTAAQDEDIQAIISQPAQGDDDQAAEQQSSEVGDEIATGQSTEESGQPVRGDDAETTGRALRQNVEAAGTTDRRSDVQTTDRTLPELDEVAPDPSESGPPLPEAAPNIVDELPPPETASEALEEPTTEAVDEEIDQGDTETSTRAVRGDDEAVPGPEEPAELPPPPEVPNIIDELPPPPKVSNILEELPPPPEPEEPVLEAPAESAAGGGDASSEEKPRVHKRRVTPAARRRAQEMNVDLAEVEGTGQDGQITVRDVRNKGQQKRS